METKEIFLKCNITPSKVQNSSITESWALKKEKRYKPKA
jgi:hypothetical protein